MKLKGVGVSPGISLGNALVLRKEKIIVPRYKVRNVNLEKNKFFNALEKVKKETYKTYQTALNNKENQTSDILNAYFMIIQDQRVITEVTRLIDEKHLNAEAAISDGLDIIVRMFESLDDEYIKERAEDIKDIKNRLLYFLLGIENTDISNLNKNSIIICKDLSLSDITKMDTKNLSGIIAQQGGKNSHACIIAKDLEIPAIFNVSNALDKIKNGDKIALNANSGEIIINPDKSEVITQACLYKKYICARKELDLYKDKSCVTNDGKQINLFSNVNSLQEVTKAMQNKVQGIGLFRSEFLFVDKLCPPSEEEQFKIYKSALEKAETLPVTIRTIDIGSDKNVSYIGSSFEDNPALGYRGIRISLDKQYMFKSQVRALLRASIFGNLRILLPMISTYDELVCAKNIISEVKEELLSNNIKVKKDIPIGIMIEVPSAAIIASDLAKECDFFSIGTNDLIQYTMAADRNNFLVSSLYSQYHPAILKLLSMVIKSAQDEHIECCICGEAASDSLLFPVLLGMGFNSFSMNTSSILEIKKLITELNFQEAVDLSNKVLSFKSTKDISSCLLDFCTEKNI